MTTLRPLTEIAEELDQCELEEVQLQRSIKEQRGKNEGEFCGPELGRLEDVQAHIVFLRRQIGEAVDNVTKKS